MKDLSRFDLPSFFLDFSLIVALCAILALLLRYSLIVYLGINIAFGWAFLALLIVLDTIWFVAIKTFNRWSHRLK